MNAADTFREIDTQVSEVRRALDNGGDYHTIRGHLVALQLTAQNGLREALADTETQAMNYADGFLDRQAGEPT